MLLAAGQPDYLVQVVCQCSHIAVCRTEGHGAALLQRLGCSYAQLMPAENALSQADSPKQLQLCALLLQAPQHCRTATRVAATVALAAQQSPVSLTASLPADLECIEPAKAP
jgi:hypothetical protein